jgi:hypothetical protein
MMIWSHDIILLRYGPALINTPLQRGEGAAMWALEPLQRFPGYSRAPLW